MKTALLLAAIALMGSTGQNLGTLQPPMKTKQYIEYAAEQHVVAAGKHTVVELRFRVMDGYHVNSHTPKSDFLVATAVQFPAIEGVKLAPVEYPAGKSYSFSFAPEEKLDVYEGDFVVRLPMVASAGAHELKGSLKYQACDHAACYPPKALPVDLLFTAK